MRSAASSNGLVSLVVAGLAMAACATLAGIEGPDPSSQPGAGAGDGGKVEVLPDAIDFGPQPCGVDAPPREITIANPTGAPVNYKVIAPEGTPFRIEGQVAGTLGPRDAPVTLKVTVAPDAPAALEASVLVSVDAEVRTIGLKASGEGATVEISPPVAALGEVRMQTGGTADIVVHNGGNKTLALTRFDGLSADFTMASDGAASVPPGEDKTLTVALAPAASPDPSVIKTELVPVVSGALCGKPPTVTVTGRRVNNDVPISSADFGKQPCNGSPTKTVTIQNYTTSQFSYSASLASGTFFKILDPGPGVVAAGSSASPTSASIVLGTLAPVTELKTSSDTLKVDVTGPPAPEGGQRLVPVTLDVRGAIVTETPTSITDFNAHSVPFYDDRKVTFTNSGNEPISLSYDLAANTLLTWTLSFPGTLNAGQTIDGNVRFFPQLNTCPCSATVTPSASGGGPLCAPLAQLTFSGVK